MTASGELEKIIHAAEQEVRAVVRQRGASYDIFSLGATDIDPRHLALWIITVTDAQRDVLQHDASLRRAIRTILKNNGYPADAIAQVAIVIQSEETVSRDFRGNWWYAIK